MVQLLQWKDDVILLEGDKNLQDEFEEWWDLNFLKQLGPPPSQYLAFKKWHDQKEKLLASMNNPLQNFISFLEKSGHKLIKAERYRFSI